MRRLSEEQRADPGLVGKLKGVPWLPIPGGEEGADAPPALVKIVADKVVLDDQLPPAPAPAADPAGRGVYIRRNVELQRYGYTEGCQGCVAAALGLAPRAHNSDCRERIRQLMAQEPEGAIRLEEARDRKRRGDAQELPEPRPRLTGPEGRQAAAAEPAVRTDAEKRASSAVGLDEPGAKRPAAVSSSSAVSPAAGAGSAAASSSSSMLFNLEILKAANMEELEQI